MRELVTTTNDEEHLPQRHGASNMTTSPGPRSSTEIRTYLKGRLNQALRRPGMFGGETALRLLFDHLAYAERQETEWARALQSLEARGAFNSLGVTGALATVLPDLGPCAGESPLGLLTTAPSPKCERSSALLPGSRRRPA
ncbi:hypothetical protein SMD20_46985 [Nonomuraea sp. LP-02]|uniref:hypothetical protein n=1 Tax=Nonomuraea sp. LP-02 TaxID=3097960 RepID=UPI002E35175C|nr:hypothetical protein [Nonomuraea sp. LP-02]MED7931837.1 hypothetical protein [Nonomuraea sp. LP-02]